MLGARVMPAYLWILCAEVRRSGDEEGVIAAGDGVVEAAFCVKVGAEYFQGGERLQVLEMGVLRHVIWDSKSKQSLALPNKNLQQFIKLMSTLILAH